MLKHILTVLALAAWVAGCTNQTAHDHDHEHEHGEGTAEAGDGKHFGETIDENNVISYEDLMAQMASSDSMPAKVVGTIGSVCQAKGCWMDMVTASEETTPMRITFKDYGFFVPKDIAGRQAVIQGYAYRSVTSVEELRHYAEDEGLPKEEIEKITEPVEEIKFLASGVLLLDQGTN